MGGSSPEYIVETGRFRTMQLERSIWTVFLALVDEWKMTAKSDQLIRSQSGMALHDCQPLLALSDMLLLSESQRRESCCLGSLFLSLGVWHESHANPGSVIFLLHIYMEIKIYTPCTRHMVPPPQNHQLQIQHVHLSKINARTSRAPTTRKSLSIDS